MDREGILYVADFQNYCVVRFSPTDDGNGTVVVGQRGKQLADVDYLKDLQAKYTTIVLHVIIVMMPITISIVYSI